MGGSYDISGERGWWFGPPLLVAEEMGKISGILSVLGVRVNMISDGPFVGIYKKKKHQR